MREIDIDHWDRKEHFRFFGQSDLPFYNVSFNVDISGVKEYAGKLGVSFNNTLIHLTVKSMKQVRNFLYRIEQCKVYEYDDLSPSFTCLKDGEELFRMITVPYAESLPGFDASIKKAIDQSTSYFDLQAFAGRSNFVFISNLPWIPFTGIDHTLSLKRDDSIPRVSWGRFFRAGDAVLLPYNVQVNHRLIDGIHVGRFYEVLHAEIRKLTAAA